MTDQSGQPDLTNIVTLAGLPKATADTLSEHSTAVAFVKQYRNMLLYDHNRGSWYEWTGSRWKIEPTRHAFDLARSVVVSLAGGDDGKVMREVGRSSFISGVEKIACADRAFAVTSDVWDSDPFLLGTPGGTVDLHSGELRPAAPSDRISKSTAVTPAKDSGCNRWRQFLDESTGGDAGMQRFLQQWAGYCLTGETNEHALLFVHGPGRNGKSVFLNTVSAILDAYGVQAPMSTFTAARSDQHPTDLAMLAGARLVVASETEEGRTWAEARIKQLTGGDPITARFMRRDFFTYQPKFKLTIIGNHAPGLSNVDEATRRRFNIVPFLHTPPQPDSHLFDKLREEWPSILRWMIEGALDWRENGLIRAGTITTATTEYFGDQDLLGQWLDEHTDAEPDNGHKTAKSGDLFRSWAAFATAAGEIPGTQKAFSSKLKARGFTKDRTGIVRFWRGIRLRVVEDSDGNFGSM